MTPLGFLESVVVSDEREIELKLNSKKTSGESATPSDEREDS